MLKKIETFTSNRSLTSLTDDFILTVKMTAGAIHDKGTEDAGLVAGMLEVWVVVADGDNVEQKAYRYYSLDAIRDSFQARPTDCTHWIVAGHSIPEEVMIDILDWTYTTQWHWLAPTDEAG